MRFHNKSESQIESTLDAYYIYIYGLFYLQVKSGHIFKGKCRVNMPYMKHLDKDLMEGSGSVPTFQPSGIGSVGSFPGAIMVMWKMSWISSLCWGQNPKPPSTLIDSVVSNPWRIHGTGIITGGKWNRHPQHSRKSGSVSALLIPETFGEWTRNLIYRWWQLKCFFYVHPDPRRNDPILTKIFSDGWFNRQLVESWIFGECFGPENKGEDM